MCVTAMSMAMLRTLASHQRDIAKTLPLQSDSEGNDKVLLRVLSIVVYVENVHHDFLPLIFTVQRLLSYRECFYEDNLNLPL